MWDFCVTEERIAAKDYHCDASEYVFGMLNNDEIYEALSPDERLIMDAFIANKRKIKKGDRYLITKGKCDGGFCVFRASILCNKICIDNELYCDY